MTHATIEPHLAHDNIWYFTPTCRLCSPVWLGPQSSVQRRAKDNAELHDVDVHHEGEA